jgi:DNA polymerase I
MSKTNLMAILEKELGNNEYWIIDLFEQQVSPCLGMNNHEKLLVNNIVMLTDAKRLLTLWQTKPKPEQRVICLNTIKKLISKNSDEIIKIPEFFSADEALKWTKTIATEVFERIHKLNLADLCALECQVILAILSMEKKGLPFNRSKWVKALESIENESQKSQNKLNSLLASNDGFAIYEPQAIDLNNAKDVKQSLEKLLGYKISGTSQSSLKGIDHEAVNLIISYREQARMLNTYGHSFLEKIENNRIRGNYISIGCLSGRIACKEPNLLALPNHPLFQQCIEPLEPYQILHFDYEAFELRILAAMSQDQKLLNIFHEGKDIHSMVAKTIFNTEVTKTKNFHLRNQAKILNFGIIYGMKEITLAKHLNTSLSQAKDLLQNYFKQFPRVHDFLSSLEMQAQKNKYAQTALGRRVYFFRSNENTLGYMARLARNMPIQGTGADIIKIAMCKVFKKLHEARLDASLVNVVHDEIVIECHKEHKREVQILVQDEMRQAFNAIFPHVSVKVSAKDRSSNKINFSPP